MKDSNWLDTNPPPTTTATAMLTIDLAQDPALDLVRIPDYPKPLTIETITRTLKMALQHLLPLSNQIAKAAMYLTLMPQLACLIQIIKHWTTLFTHPRTKVKAKI